VCLQQHVGHVSRANACLINTNNRA
jgi:hypothetical protein